MKKFQPNENYQSEHAYMRPEVNLNRFEKSFCLHGDFTAATCK